MKWIEAGYLEVWVRTTRSKADLPAVLAALICATTNKIQAIRFPGRGKGQ